MPPTVATPSLTFVSYDGGTLWLSCVPPSDPAYSQYHVMVSDVANGGTVTRATVPALSIGVPVSLGASTYQVAIAFSDGTRSGPASAPAPIVSGPPPTFTQIVCSYESLSAGWTSVAGRPTYGLQVQWDRGGTVSYLSGTSGTVTLPPSSPQVVPVVASVFAAQNLPAGTQLWSVGPPSSITVQPSLAGTTVTGAALATQAPIYTAPQRFTATRDMAVVPSTVDGGPADAPPPGSPLVTMVDYTGSSLVVGWQTVAQATGYQAYLVSPGDTTVTQSTSDTVATFNQTLTGGPWNVIVAPVTVSGTPPTTIIGPSSYPYNPIVSPPTLTSVRNDVSVLTLSWQPVGGAAGYLAAVGRTGTSATTYNAGIGNSYAITGAFTTNGWTCAVQAYGGGGIVVGPSSPPATLIAAQAGWTGGDFDGQNLSLTWTAANDPSVTGYSITIQGSTAAGSTVGNTTAAVMAQALSPSLQYQALIYATNGIVRGPSNSPLVLLSAPPRTLWLGYQTSVCAAWSPPVSGTITGYTAQLTANGVIVDTQSPTETLTTFRSGLNAGVVYAASVRAVRQGVDIVTVRGPWSPPQTGPYAQSTTYSFDGLGRLATLRWGTAATQSYSFDAAGNLLTIAGTVSSGDGQ